MVFYQSREIYLTVTSFDLLGTLAFAISGALLGKQKQYNFWGVLTLAFCAALGGGTLRNMMVNLTPDVLSPDGWMYILCVVAASLVIHLGADIFQFRSGAVQVSANRLLARADAVGLAVFVMMGATVAMRVGLPFFAVLAFSALSGAGGGVIRDVIAGEKPYAFRGVHYITWCILGGTVAALLNFWRPAIEAATGVMAYKGIFALLPSSLVVVLRFREINKEFPLPA
ncbi:MAG: hypothetical protein A3G34_02945 [Candidatus Lindowbacteria bacterium RIFCSPLOWO2_12_FULL_62_27]|nr:MAG: hypothetical protein A3G34_02945 [Candidatus Lindowbacteria bacterium RIFCSPLOWO2_12_FULL_62_27]OGH61680.1 MAG: hypothetical protein A3I06_01725 [Candidatus Lindowbacteria bacterium RIFCSPLOWO2_02_FULL_62_12]